ncbi:paramyosin-like isoform X1 [Acanthopagrus latus]|uniref:paramyosin-like isoform X1 n=1 Tax=Acanthopagrus latus TaxID=8177 RepID=UPI00187BD37F|nr:paramyosin-like isoform X1 [Acanthopagrus latus]
MENSSERPIDISRERLIQELEETREQLKKQKTLKEMYINRGKETTRELERLRKYSDDATLSSTKIATQVRDNTRQKKKKDLHKDYEELKVAHLINEEKYQADLQAEKDKNSLLQKELDQISISYNELKVRYETDVIEVRQQVETLKHKLQGEAQQRKLLQQHNELEIAQASSQDKYTAELQVEQQKNNILKDKLDKISQRYETDVTEVRHQVETLRHELQGEAQQRKLLQQQHNELEIAQASSQDKYTAELQVEQQKNNPLQDKIEKISQGYESEVITVRQQAESLQRELEKEVKAHVDTMLRDLQVITNLKAEQNDLRHSMTEEINNLKQKTLEKEEYYERQLEELKSQLTAQVSLSLVLSTELKALKEAEIPEEKPCEQESIVTTSAPELLEVTKIPEEKAREQESIDIVSAPELLEVTKIPEEKACEQESIASAPAFELLDVTQVSEETHPAKSKKSSWKRVRHFLGLRKPQKWKK